MPPPTTRRLPHLLVGACLVGAPLALGGAHTVTNLVVATLLVVATGVALASSSRTEASLWVCGVLAVAWAATALQLIPLPVGLFELASPGTFDALSLAPGVAGAWRPASLDPPATAHELVKGTIVLCGAALAAKLYGRQRSYSLNDLLRLIALAGGAVLLLGLVQAAAGFDRPYGTFGPVTHRTLVSSFINSNHLAGFLGLASLATLALALETRRGPRWLYVLAAVAMGAGVIVSLSRGGIAAFVAAAGLCAVVLLHSRFARRAEPGERPRSRLRPTLIVLGVLVAVLGVAGYVAYTEVVHELWTLGDEKAYFKAQIWLPLPALVAAFPLFGVGRGAFGMVYPRFSTLRADILFSHLENEWLQAVVDWGPLLGGVIVVGLLAAFAQAVRRSRTQPARLIAAFALVHVGLHNLMDFSLTLSAVALPAAMLLSVLAQPESPERRPRGWTPSRAWAWAALAVLALGTGVAGWYAIDFEVDRDYARLRRTLDEAPASARLEAGPTRDDIEQIIARHPSNFVLPMWVAHWELSHGRRPAAAIHWINRAMFLSPGASAPHRLAGQALLRLGRRDQGLLEYRLACDDQPAVTLQVAAEITQITGEARDVAGLASQIPSVREATAAFLLGKKEPALALGVLEPEGTPIATEAGLRLAANALGQLQRYEEAHARAGALEALVPDRAEGYLVQAELFVAQKDLEAALAVTERGLARTRFQDQLLYSRALLLRDLKRYPEARAAAEKMLSLTAEPGRMAASHYLLGALWAREGRRPEAVRAYQRAVSLQPKHGGYVGALVRLRMEMGDFPGARLALDQARGRGVRSAGLDALAAELAAKEAGATEAARQDLLRGPAPPDQR